LRGRSRRRCGGSPGPCGKAFGGSRRGERGGGFGAAHLARAWSFINNYTKPITLALPVHDEINPWHDAAGVTRAVESGLVRGVGGERASAAEGFARTSRPLPHNAARAAQRAHAPFLSARRREFPHGWAGCRPAATDFVMLFSCESAP
jgi:hypothetical protein